MKVSSLIVAACAALPFALAMIGCETKSPEAPASTVSGDRCPHEIKAEKCPFCTPSLIESDGFCGEHGVAEALCYLCRPYPNAAFRAKGDWCAEHKAPDSQCVACHPELKENVKPGSGHGTKAPTSGQG
jgi:hypothetical protein